MLDNHKPDSPPDHARLGKGTSKSYDLTYSEGAGNNYKYRGNRTSGDGKYVLIFDPRKEVFVLHLVDSTFNLNLIQTPDNKDADSLKREYPHLKNSDTKAATGKGKGGAAAQSKAGKAGKAGKVPKKEQAKPAAPKKRTAESDEESSDDDDGLEIEFPGGPAPTSNRDFSPAFPPRRFSDFVADPDEEEDDADGEDDDDDMSEEHFKLPSPMTTQTTSTLPPAPVPQPEALNQSISLTFDPDSESEEDEEPAPPPPAQPEPEQDDDMDIDLEAELEAELGAQSDAESDVSEED